MLAGIEVSATNSVSRALSATDTSFPTRTHAYLLFTHPKDATVMYQSNKYVLHISMKKWVTNWKRCCLFLFYWALLLSLKFQGMQILSNWDLYDWYLYDLYDWYLYDLYDWVIKCLNIKSSWINGYKTSETWWVNTSASTFLLFRVGSLTRCETLIVGHLTLETTNIICLTCIMANLTILLHIEELFHYSSQRMWILLLGNKMM